MATVVTLLYFLSYLPWYVKDRKAKSIESIEVEEKINV